MTGAGVLARSRVGRAVGRNVLRAWGRLGIAPGYQVLAVERAGAELAESGSLVATLPNGCRMPCDLRDHVQRAIWFQGVYEPIEAYLFTKLLRQGMVVIDAGANVGQYTLLAATAVGPDCGATSGRVHAFEPVAQNFAALVDAVRANRLFQVTCARVALWHEETLLSFAVPAGYSTVHDRGTYRPVGGSESGGQNPTPATTLDQYVDRHKVRRVDVIKMDIEGSESAALAGARETLTRFRPTILMELLPSMFERGGDLQSTWELLRSLDYRFWKIGLGLERCGPIGSPAEVGSGANVLIYQGVLPIDVTTGWTVKSVLRWARSGW